MSTAIEWTDETWNPITGCTKVSPGCAHCYAETVAKRFWPTQYRVYGEGERQHGGKGRPRKFGDIETHADRLEQPLHWRRPRRVFVNSMSDLFHEAVPDAFIDRVFAVMACAPHHTFQVLTKRADRMRAVLSDPAMPARIDGIFLEPGFPLPSGGVQCIEQHGNGSGDRWPLPNVWLGVSMENQRFADQRIPLLLQTPAAVRFVSAEPLLGPVDLTGGSDPLRTWLRSGLMSARGILTDHWWPPLDWVIVGGESGAGARPFDLAWARAIVAQCKSAGVPVFVKQLGADPRSDEPTAWPNGRITPYPFMHPHLRDRKGGDPTEWPDDLRVREWPTVRG